jgi:RimJ/RimL family protein N-acetyltransferase
MRQVKKSKPLEYARSSHRGSFPARQSIITAASCDAGTPSGVDQTCRARPGFTADPIRTPRLTLRTIDEHDRSEMLHILRTSAEHLTSKLPLKHPGESETSAFERQISLARNGDTTGPACNRAPSDHRQRIVGGVALYAITRGLTWEAAIHWWIRVEDTGRGYGSEIVRAALAHGTADLPDGLGLHIIRAWIDPANHPSLALARRLGFRHIGRASQPLLVGDRWERHDEYIYHAPIPHP